VRARGAAGVAAVLSGQDLAASITPFAPRLDGAGFWPTAWPPLAPQRVRFVGEAVIALCAESPAQAADACELVEIHYEPLAPIADVESALTAGAPLLHDGVPGNVLFRRDYLYGDVDGAFARAHIVLRETFSHGRCSASPLEARGIAAAWEGDRLTVWSGTQAPHIFRTALARAFRLPEGHVRVVVPDTGGGFGQKMHVLPEDVALAALARVAGRPVKRS